MSWSESYTAPKGLASDAYVDRIYDGYRHTRRIIPHRHKPPSIRRRIRAGDENAVWAHPRRSRPSARRLRLHILRRIPTVDEAWLILDTWLEDRYRIRATDVMISDFQGTFVARLRCGDKQALREGCEQRCGIHHTYRLWEADESSLDVCGEYSGGGYHRGPGGRFLSPFRTWTVLYEDAVKRGDPIALFKSHIRPIVPGEVP